MHSRLFGGLIAIVAISCVVSPSSNEDDTSSESSGDGDGDIPGDGDGEPGDGDSEGEDESESEGDGDGDGEGEEWPSDGDITDEGTGDGDGDGDEPRSCDEGLTLCCPDWDPDCGDSYDGPENGQGDPQWQRRGCLDTQVSRFHCGGCANLCPSDDLEDGHPGRCELAQCQPIYQGCVHAEEPTLTCNDVCASIGKTCAGNECGFAEPGGHTMRVFTPGMDGCWDGVYSGTVDVACDEPIPADKVPAEVSCCCTVE